MNSAAMFFITAFAAFAIPLAVAIIFVRKTGAKILPLFVGALTFFVFANVLEGLFHTVFLLGDNELARFINSNTVVYALYGGLAAGIFEETGRFIAFKTLLKKHDARETAISYGIGHGGIEAILTVGANYILLGVICIAGDALRGTLPDMLFDTAGAVTASTCAVAIFERCFAMLFHVSASVLVFAAAKRPGMFWLYPLAVLLHAALDFPAAFYQAGSTGLISTELIIAGISCAVAYFAFRLYKKI